MQTDPSNPVQRPVAIPRLLTTERPVKIRKAPAPPSAPTKAPPTTANSKLSTLGPAKAGFKPVFGAKKPACIQKPKASVGKISATKGSKIAKPLGAAKSGAVVASKSKTTTTAAPKSTFNPTTTMGALSSLRASSCIHVACHCAVVFRVSSQDPYDSRTRR